MFLWIKFYVTLWENISLYLFTFLCIHIVCNCNFRSTKEGSMIITNHQLRQTFPKTKKFHA